jgi:hypothetical protein
MDRYLYTRSFSTRPTRITNQLVTTGNNQDYQRIGNDKQLVATTLRPTRTNILLPGNPDIATSVYRTSQVNKGGGRLLHPIAAGLPIFLDMRAGPERNSRDPQKLNTVT